MQEKQLSFGDPNTQVAQIFSELKSSSDLVLLREKEPAPEAEATLEVHDSVAKTSKDEEKELS
ncbi:hypothetical protein SESBI_28303 [Sesbania bispinosa]|nr:hypothetical protein SESBI_28303 [Sesbania bispinosa]